MTRRKLSRAVITTTAVVALALAGALPAGADLTTPNAVEPTAEPTTSPSPTVEPAAEPTSEPSSEPTTGPSSEPTTDAVPAPATSPEPSTAGSVPSFTYRGVGLRLPEGWPVIDLTSAPQTCVRADSHAVYLGSPGADQDCPSSLLGRVGTIRLEPAPAELPFGVVTLMPGPLPAPDSAQRTAGEIAGVVDGTDVLLTLTLEPDGSLPDVGEITVRAEEATPRATLAAVAAADPVPLDRSFTWHYGQGFDACNAPSLATMQAWLASPFRSVGIYMGGISRACATQPNLTPSWLRSIAASGWKVTPIYVGLQAPCSGYKNRITYGQEWTQGRDAALDAVARARALGLGPGSDIYFDMESYTQSPECSGSVRAFLSSWTQALNYNGYSSGVYSSAATGIEDLAQGFAQPGYVPPNKIWIARWNGVPDVYGHDAYVPDNLWAPYARIHQYRGGHDEVWGGVTINIDSNVLDTDPNRGSPTGQIDAVSTAPGLVTATGWAMDPEAGTGPITVQMYLDGRTQTVSTANAPRPDIGAAFPAAGPDHGYSISISASAGWHGVCVYAINVGPGTSKNLGCRSVLVPSSDPFGQIDVVTTGYGTVTASGWAIDPNTSAPIPVQMYLDGRTQTVATAGRARPDVGTAYPAAGPNHGYSVSMPSPAGQHTVCVYAINVGQGASTLMGCRGVVVPPPNPFGNIDSVTGAPGSVTASGWAIDPDTTSPIPVQMYVDGRTNSVGTADRSRPDVGQVHPAFGSAHGYQLTMPATPGRHYVCLYGINVGPGSSVLLGCRFVDVPSADPFGSYESVSATPGTVTATGWTIDPDTSSPILVQLYLDGRTQTVARADVSRLDVGAVYPSAGPNHGFRVSIAATRGRHTACVYGINTGAGASSLLGCRVVDVP